MQSRAKERGVVSKLSKPSFTFEKRARSNGFSLIAGLDEAGRGPLAGPVVAAACVLPLCKPFKGLADSKRLTSKEREACFKKLVSHSSVHYGIGIVEADQIDRINILQATLLAMLRALEQLSVLPDYLLIDGIHAPKTELPFETVIEGDARSYSIAAASILAKVTRDRQMIAYHALYPRYGFDRHKGYATAKHLEAIQKWGACPLHRKSFDPIRELAQLKFL
ncbi:MAG TPA: ribonuclease HII [Parachlamydiales bacterium]|nr:ribonuclease HII [Parachlamydiales bacterium]